MNNNFQIFKQTDKVAAAAEAGESLNNFLTENKSRPVLLMLSGGSAFSILDYVGSMALGENLTVSVLDERFSADPAVNNFAQMQKLDFYQLALEAGTNFFGTLPRNNETQEELAQRWEQNLRQWQTNNHSGLIAATLGMGSDGHTAGIFPFPEDAKKFTELFESDSLVAAYNAVGKNQFPERLTTTATFFKRIDFGFAYVCGSEKQEKFKQVIGGKASENQLPAMLWHRIKNAKVFTDT